MGLLAFLACPVLPLDMEARATHDIFLPRVWEAAPGPVATTTCGHPGGGSIARAQLACSTQLQHARGIASRRTVGHAVSVCGPCRRKDPLCQPCVPLPLGGAPPVR